MKRSERTETIDDKLAKNTHTHEGHDSNEDRLAGKTERKEESGKVTFE